MEATYKKHTLPLLLGIPLDKGLAHMHFVYYSSFSTGRETQLCKNGNTSSTGPMQRKQQGVSPSYKQVISSSSLSTPLFSLDALTRGL